MLVDDPFAADDHHVLLQFIDFQHALDQAIDVERRFGDEHDVGLAVRRSQRQVARMPAHDFDDGDPPMAFGRGADALHAPGRNEDGRRKPRRHIVDHLVEVEFSRDGGAYIAVAGRFAITARGSIRRARGGSSGPGRCRSSWGPGRSAGNRTGPACR